MKGKYHIEISNRKLQYWLDVERKVTLIKGNSGTGKTTLIRMLQGYLEQGNKSGIRMKNEQNVPISVFTAITNWERDLEELAGYIIFADESVDFLYSKGFQKIFSISDNYLVIISRSGHFNHLPFAIGSIYELRTRQRQNVGLTQMYKLYEERLIVQKSDLIITEDSNSGKEMMQEMFNCPVESANGNGNISSRLEEYLKKDKRIYVIVDGAAFGGFIEQTMNLAKLQGNAVIIAPESFEYLLLMTDGLKKYLSNELTETWNYCDSLQFITWERFYTYLLDKICYEKFGFHYSKHKLHGTFITENNFLQIKALLEKCMVVEV